YVHGAYRLASLLRCSATDAVLPAGQGTSGTVGIRGIAVAYGGSNGIATPNVTVIKDCIVEDVYSEDLDYAFDQDGIYVSSRLLGSVAHIEGGLVKNSLGRSVKSQSLGGTIISGLQIFQDQSLNVN